ncbi:hypothetical protein A2U01_0100515, partial [Trifolium medium]|nr:hypothetical protein [Trifolium medium]
MLADLFRELLVVLDSVLADVPFTSLNPNYSLQINTLLV